MKRKTKVTKHTITIKRRLINVSNYLKKFIFHNINYRRYVYNEFVKESRKYEPFYNFDPLAFKTHFFNNNEVQNECLDELYCVGISKQVSMDMVHAKKTMMTKGKKSKEFYNFKYRSFDRFKGSFRVNTAVTETPDIYGVNRLSTRVFISDTNMLIFRVKRNKFIYLETKEPLFRDAFVNDDNITFVLDKSKISKCGNIKYGRCRYQMKDVREIGFSHEFGKFYIYLTIDMTFINTITDDKGKAGIDFGIHNPLTITDSSGNYKLQMSDKEIRKIRYLEKRIKRLNSILSNKFMVNRLHGREIRSKNSYKILRKIKLSWNKIKHIRENWRKKISNILVNTYSCIIMDRYNIPDNSNSVIPKYRIKIINRKNREHSMYLCMNFIEYSCIKYGIKYRYAPEGTTSTCSICGYKNSHLPLEKRYLHCSNCNTVIDRDVNASRNCYNHIFI